MSSIKKSPRTLLMSCALVAVCALAAGIYGGRDIGLTNDSMSYWLAAQNLREGHGSRIPILSLSSKPDARKTVPLLIQPPMFPAILAVAQMFTDDPKIAGLIINAICAAAVAMLAMGIGRQLAPPESRTLSGIAAGLATCLSAALTQTYGVMLSDLPFFTFWLATVYLLVRARASGRSGAWLVAAGLTASAAIATRYAGLSLIPVIAWEALRSGRRSAARIAINLLAGAVMPVLMLGMLWARNIAVVGNIRGNPGTARDLGRPLLQALSGTLRSVEGVLGVAGLILVLIAVGVFLLTRRWQRKLVNWTAVEVFAVAVAVYTAVMTYTMMHYLWHFERRFFIPPAASILMLGASVIGASWPALRGRRMLQSACALALLMVCAWPVVRPTPGWNWPLYLPRMQAYQWLAANIKPGEVIVTDKSQPLAFYSGHPVLLLPNRRWDRQNVVPTDLGTSLPVKMNELAARYLVIFCDRKGLDEQDWGTFVANLSRRGIGGRFHIVFESDDGVVYRLKEQP